jgi:hypothetical protein
VVVNSGRGAALPTEVFLSHVIARAIEAVCLLMLASFDLETLIANSSHAAASPACTVLRCAMRARTSEAALALRIEFLLGRSCLRAPEPSNQPCACRFGSGESGHHGDVL